MVVFLNLNLLTSISLDLIDVKPVTISKYICVYKDSICLLDLRNKKIKELWKGKANFVNVYETMGIESDNRQVILSIIHFNNKKGNLLENIVLMDNLTGYINIPPWYEEDFIGNRDSLGSYWLLGQKYNPILRQSKLSYLINLIKEPINNVIILDCYKSHKINYKLIKKLRGHVNLIFYTSDYIWAFSIRLFSSYSSILEDSYVKNNSNPSKIGTCLMKDELLNLIKEKE